MAGGEPMKPSVDVDTEREIDAGVDDAGVEVPAEPCDCWPSRCMCGVEEDIWRAMHGWAEER